MLQPGNAIVCVASTAKTMHPINACHPGQGSEEVHAHACRTLCQIAGRSVWTCHETNNIWHLLTEPDSGNSNRPKQLKPCTRHSKPVSCCGARRPRQALSDSSTCRQQQPCNCHAMPPRTETRFTELLPSKCRTWLLPTTRCIGAGLGPAGGALLKRSQRHGHFRVLGRHTHSACYFFVARRPYPGRAELLKIVLQSLLAYLRRRKACQHSTCPLAV